MGMIVHGVIFRNFMGMRILVLFARTARRDGPYHFSESLQENVWRTMDDGLLIKHVMGMRILIPYAGPLRNAQLLIAAQEKREAHSAWP
jgi:hypothetical protein